MLFERPKFRGLGLIFVVLISSIPIFVNFAGAFIGRPLVISGRRNFCLKATKVWSGNSRFVLPLKSQLLHRTATANIDCLHDIFENAASFFNVKYISLPKQTYFPLSSSAWFCSDSGEANHEIIIVFVEVNNQKFGGQELSAKISLFYN